MINSCCECNLRWFEGVICWEMNCQEKYSTLIGTVIWPHYCSLPMEHIISNRTCWTLCWWVPGQVIQFLVDSLQSHGGRRVAAAPRGGDGGGEGTGKDGEGIGGLRPPRRPRVRWEVRERGSGGTGWGPGPTQLLGLPQRSPHHPAAASLCDAAPAAAAAAAAVAASSSASAPPP